MLNQEEFIKRLHKVLEYYNLTAATFADEISVQRSSISHILSGRNKPSLEFVLKMANTYKEITLDWLLHGKGEFPKKETKEVVAVAKTEQKDQHSLFDHPIETNTEDINADSSLLPQKKITTPSTIERIVIFYKDGRFKEYINP